MCRRWLVAVPPGECGGSITTKPSSSPGGGDLVSRLSPCDKLYLFVSLTSSEVQACGRAFLSESGCVLESFLDPDRVPSVLFEVFSGVNI